MCTQAQPVPPAEIGLYWSDEQIILFLLEYKPGSNLPDNVLVDLSPYQYPPFNLPEGMWYMVNSNEEKEAVSGFWKANGEACKIYSNPVINGWRTTLDYFEGESPHGQRTDWLMQEYTITQSESFREKDNPKESRSLCRVFLCSGDNSKNEVDTKKCNTESDIKNIASVEPIVSSGYIISDQDSGSESKPKEHDWMQLLAEAEQRPATSTQSFSELDCFLRGDFLELNDLEDPLSHSSSSQNSSCCSMLSDEYFDSVALLGELEEEGNKDVQEKQSSSRYSFNTAVRPTDVVLQPTSEGSVLSSAKSTDIVEGSQNSPTTHEKLKEKRPYEHTTPRQDSKTEGPSNAPSVGSPSSTSHSNVTPSREKKAAGGGGRMKKFKLFFCFMLP